MTDAAETSGRFPGRALVIGVSAYPGGQALPAAVRRDAEDIAEALSDPSISAYPADRVARLLDGEATAAAILNGLDRLAADSRIGDTVVIYFSGHGARRPSPGLLAADLDPGTGRPALISRDALSDRLARIVSDRVLVILDACYAGGAAVLKSGFETVPTGPELADLFEGKGRVVIASATDRQPSAVLEEHRNSVFTGELLKALRGGAFGEGDRIGVLELFTTAAAGTRAIRPEQTPYLRAELSDNFPVGRRPMTAKTAAEPTAAASEALWEVFAALYPFGPQDQAVWRRAGGDLSRLPLSGPGRTQWFEAFRLLELGGGGTTSAAVVAEALRDYPRHPRLFRFSR